MQRDVSTRKREYLIEEKITWIEVYQIHKYLERGKVI